MLFNQKTGIQGVAICTVIAWLLQLLIQLPSAKKFGYKFKLKIDLNDPNLKKVFLLAIPIFISTAVLPINNLVSTRLASGMDESALSALEYAYKLYIVISGVFTYAIGNIIFPELSRASTEKDGEEFKNIIVKAIKLLSFILIPLTLGIIIYRQDIVSIMYERGEFTRLSTIKTSGVLLYYALGMIGAGIVEIMNKSFYAKQDTKTPLYIGIFVIITNVILSIMLGNTSLKYNGLALATSITTLINAMALIFMANKNNIKIITKDLIVYMIKIFLLAFLMAEIVIIINLMLSNVLFGGIIKDIVRILIGAVIGVISYFILTMLFDANELKGLLKKDK